MHVAWRAELSAFTVLLGRAPLGFADALTPAALTAEAPVADTPDGRHAAIGPPGRDHQLALLDETDGTTPLGFWVPLDPDAGTRLAAAARLWHRLRAGRGDPPEGLTPLQRARHLLMLRALHGSRSGASVREIAAALFGIDLHGAAWKGHDLRSRTRRLLDEGRDLVRGGYRRLLAPNRRR